jgi:ferredoxin
MKVSVDASTCVGCGLCESNCPEVFKVDASGIAKVLKQESKCDLKELAGQCPVNAIIVE